MGSTKYLLVALVTAAAVSSGAAWASETSKPAPTDQQIEELKARVEALESQRENDKKQDAQISETVSRIDEIEGGLLKRETGRQIKILDEFMISASGTFIVQGAHNANSVLRDQSDPVDPSFSADLTFEKTFSKISGSSFLHLESGKGTGIDDALDVYSNVNRDADDEIQVRVTELWYEQNLFNEALTITLGFLDPTVYFDNNTAANDETTQFLGSMFRNSPTIEFPDNSIGLRIGVAPLDWFSMSYGVINANGAWKNIFQSLFHIGQIIFMPKINDLEGHYRFLVWRNGLSHTWWSDGETGKASYGFGVSFDQKVAEPVTLFARYGWQAPNPYNVFITDTDGSNYSLSQSWSAGASLSGSWWHRDDDVLAIGVGQAIPSAKYRDATGLLARNELHIEAYYNFHVNKHLALSPDVQVIWNPFGKDSPADRGVVSVFGLRTQIYL